MSKKSELILHPVRLRLVTELGERQMTTRQLAEALPDIAQATLYRQIKRLLDGDIFRIVDEQLINGAVERTYALVAEQNKLTKSDLAGLSAEDHTQLFSIFAAGLIDLFSSYVESADLTNFEETGLSYNRAVIYLSAEERAEFQSHLFNIVSSVLKNQPTAERKRYTLASVVIPDERNQP